MTYRDFYDAARPHFENPPVRGLLIMGGVYFSDDLGVVMPQDVYRKLQLAASFTRDDVRRHRQMASEFAESLRLRALGSQLRDYAKGDPFDTGTRRIQEEHDWHESMADRIEAMLPPGSP